MITGAKLIHRVYSWEAVAESRRALDAVDSMIWLFKKLDRSTAELEKARSVLVAEAATADTLHKQLLESK